MKILLASDNLEDRGYDTVMSWGVDIVDLIKTHAEEGFIWGEIIELNELRCERLLVYDPYTDSWRLP